MIQGKWMELEEIMLNEARFRKTKNHVFYHTQKTDPKDKCIHKHDHVHIYRQKMFAVMELYYGT
jgi:hypothetical protein